MKVWEKPVGYINCWRRAVRVANGELSVRNALTTLFFIYDENAPRADSRVANKVVRAPALHLQ
jgi:hypothetical protein